MHTKRFVSEEAGFLIIPTFDIHSLANDKNFTAIMKPVCVNQEQNYGNNSPRS